MKNSYLKGLSSDPKIKEYFESLIGMTLEDACKKLGSWWMCVSSHPTAPYAGNYCFERSAGARLELRIKDGKVESEQHNGMALHYAKVDIYEYNKQQTRYDYDEEEILQVAGEIG